MAEPNMIYKIAVLCLLSKVDSSLSNAQLVQFFLDKEYTDYFTIQQIIGDLEDASYITAETDINNTLYHLTVEGSRTLDLMRDKLTDAIVNDITEYLKDIQMSVKVDNALFADYDRATGGGYVVHLRFEQNKRTMLDLTLHAATAAQASTICNNWKARHEDVYMNLMDTLI